jgi:hypothetical protein
MYFHSIHKSRKRKIQKLSQLQTNPDRYIHSLGTKPARDLTWERGMRCVRIAASRVWRITRDSSIARLQQRSREEKCGTPRQTDRQRKRERKICIFPIYIYSKCSSFKYCQYIFFWPRDWELSWSRRQQDNSVPVTFSSSPSFACAESSHAIFTPYLN